MYEFEYFDLKPDLYMVDNCTRIIEVICSECSQAEDIQTLMLETAVYCPTFKLSVYVNAEVNTMLAND